ncbi:hypothetical protein [Pseudodonghicola flavimaris]|uniref:Uncharacterized protein n=1 Tax=Pseudodonghicola flavimaris TaxID=3050036 RepID=A0ABT7EZD2_9RHOB|nr:hypothetical protein [Pseudodonghicola flavimaris]MDK3017609.1 hypothetical protein [Pseudodonghicola flavimaris]
MTIEADLLGRPPVMRPIPRLERPGGFLRVPGKLPGRVSVRVPVRGSFSPVGEGCRWVTLPAAPWEEWE